MFDRDKSLIWHSKLCRLPTCYLDRQSIGGSVQQTGERFSVSLTLTYSLNIFFISLTYTLFQSVSSYLNIYRYIDMYICITWHVLLSICLKLSRPPLVSGSRSSAYRFVMPEYSTLFAFYVSLYKCLSLQREFPSIELDPVYSGVNEEMTEILRHSRS